MKILKKRKERRNELKGDREDVIEIMCRIGGGNGIGEIIIGVKIKMRDFNEKIESLE